MKHVHPATGASSPHPLVKPAHANQYFSHAQSLELLVKEQTYMVITLIASQLICFRLLSEA